MSDQGSIPSSWLSTKLGDVCTHPQYGFTTKAADQGELKFLRTTDITSGEIDWGSVPYCRDKPDSAEKYLLEDGDVVISRAGSVGVSYLLKSPPRSVFASYLIRFRPLINHQFFAYFLISPFYWREIAENKVGIAVGNVNASKLREIPFPLPPLAEQRRIVAKIEELFSELDKGIENLKLAQAQLTVYRQALLKHAFEGKLTAAWRAKQLKTKNSKLETGTELLARIRAERQEHYEQEVKNWKLEVNKWESSGKIGKRPFKPSSVQASKVISAEELDLLKEIPAEWVWTRVENLGIVQLGRQRSPKNISKKHPVKYIRAANITADGLSLEDVKDMEFLPHELENYRLVKGDLVLSEASGSASQVGKPAMWNDEIQNCCFQNTVIRHRPYIGMTGPYLLVLYKFFYRSGLFAKVSGGVGINHLSANKFAAIPVPLAPLPEQEKIVAEINRILSVSASLESDIEINLQKSETLRQSILKKAFAGALVPQDPADEPAAILHARIRAERESAAATKAAAKKSKPGGARQSVRAVHGNGGKKSSIVIRKS